MMDPTSVDALGGPAEAAGGLAARLSAEFSAPAGVLDPSGPGWLSWAGLGPDGAEPCPSRALAWGRASGVIGRGRVAVWGEERPGVAWLALPLPPPGRPGAGWLALAGFRADSVGPGAPGAWGPPCPERALLAWGRSALEALEDEAPARPAGDSDGRPGDDGDRRQILARLIRRMRVSDAPERFQGLAVNALRAALEVAAVGWVPVSGGEPVVAVGEVDGLDGQGWRRLASAAGDESWFEGRAGGPETGGAGRFVVAAADRQGSAGWLVAAVARGAGLPSRAAAELIPPVASLVGTQRTNSRIYADLKDLLFGVIRSLTAAVDAKDPYTSGHSERVARIAVRLAEELGTTSGQRSDLYLMGLLHDIGKIGVDDGVLKKTGPLTPVEYRKIQSHVEIGVHILSGLRKLHHLLPGVAHHHENFDGSGYPAGLAGESIPFEARILAVADSFDAMSSTRPYRHRLSPLKIDQIFRSGAGKQWDPRVVDALFACREDVEEIRQKGLGESLQHAVNGAIGRN